MLGYILTIIDCLTDDLRRPKYRDNPNKMAGHCYVATEALYHLLTKEQRKFWKPHQMRHENESHWFLMNVETGSIVDMTASQFKTEPDYADARCSGFLTKKPSKRAKILLRRVRRILKIEGLR